MIGNRRAIYVYLILLMRAMMKNIAINEKNTTIDEL